LSDVLDHVPPAKKARNYIKDPLTVAADKLLKGVPIAGYALPDYVVIIGFGCGGLLYFWVGRGSS